MGQLTVRDLMTPDVISVGPEENVSRVRELMYRRSIRHIPVVDNHGDLVGMVTHRDLLRRSLIERDDVPPFVEDDLLAHTPVRKVMKMLIDTASPGDDLRDAAQRMLDNKCACLPVVEGRHLVGILTEADFVKRLISELTTPPRRAPELG